MEQPIAAQQEAVLMRGDLSEVLASMNELQGSFAIGHTLAKDFQFQIVGE